MRKQLSKTAIRERLRPYTIEAIDNLVDLMRNSKNDNIRLGAIKTLLVKILPDLKAVELIGEIDIEMMSNVIRLPNKKPLPITNEG